MGWDQPAQGLKEQQQKLLQRQRAERFTLSVVMPILNLSGPCRTLGTTPQKPFSGPGVTVHALSACSLLWHEDCKPWSPLHRLLLFVRIFPLGCNCLGAPRAWGRSIRCSERLCWVLSSTCPVGSTATDIDTGVPNTG